jgi:Zn-dependent protease
MANMGREHISYLYGKSQALARRVGEMKGKIQKHTSKAVATIETAVGAGIGGVIQGHAGEKGAHVFGIPTDLGLGLVLNLLGHFDAAGADYSPHLNHLGDGFIAAFTSSVGFGWGAAWAKTGKFSFHGLGQGGGGGGALADGGIGVKGAVSESQMADIVARVRAAAGHP